MKLLELYLVVGVLTSKVIPVLVIAATEQCVVTDETAAVVNRRQVIADRTHVSELDILLHYTLTTSSVLVQLTTGRCKYIQQSH